MIRKLVTGLGIPAEVLLRHRDAHFKPGVVRKRAAG
jgi:hypothetical protein